MGLNVERGRKVDTGEQSGNGNLMVDVAFSHQHQAQAQQAG
jgi:hypothetical protein